MSFGPVELLIVFGLVLLLFGGSKLPGLARSLGRAQNEFKAGAAEGDKAARNEEPGEKPTPEK
jgi:sec-independent protein translocase protein TatA